ncbi:cytochrome b-c1 complex subunit 2, mitochondrial-like [Macrosteles quadrilineatus]|uniref:cytochrome b-c1 complex subunit 2, mitochondrial-like n=1 Tax=Macrosteles quadrilineatus TaxID=74068 RepID=UPI0023E1E2F4|nr:cytochrome b-c1 complex subunit 2, mitochondrial-like [Macrosteles quadrilineatus]
MASNVTKTPILRAISKRNYASAATLAQACADVHVKVLPNKIVIASADSAIPISRVSVLFKAGSRYESADHLGVSNVLRSSAGLSTSGASAFGIVRNLQQIGASLSVTSDREGIAYTLEATPDKIEEGLQYLVDIASKQVFKPWELSDQIPRIKYELATTPPQARILDLVNKAAYRTGLGNSIFVKEHAIGKINSETLQYFVRQTFTAPRAAVVGVGVSSDHLAQLASSLELSSGAGPEAPAKYYGGEERLEVPSPHVHIALAAESAGLQSKEALAFAVLRHALGAGSAIKYGIGAGPLGKVTADSKELLGASAFSSAYSDSGLFGVVLTTTPSNAKAAAEKVAKVLHGPVSDADVARGKAVVKGLLLQGYENGEAVVQDIGTQALLLGSVLAAPQIAAAVDALSTADVQNAAKKIASGKKSLAVYGNTSSAPYFDEIAK